MTPTNTVAQYAADGRLLSILQLADTREVWRMVRSFERLAMRPAGACGYVQGFFDYPEAGQRLEWRRSEGDYYFGGPLVRSFTVPARG